MSVTRIRAPLSGVPETMLWTLHNRAHEAMRPDRKLTDPEAVRIYQSLDYDFLKRFGPPDETHAVRSLCFDRAIKAWLREHPGGSVIGLGEGLETQRERCDNGSVRWLSVDLPEAMAVRERFLPATPRGVHLAQSALDTSWIDHVATPEAAFVTAQGLLMYLEPEQVRGLLSQVCARLPGVVIMFDAIPPWLSRKTLRGWSKTPDYQTPPMPWGIRASQLEQTLRGWCPRVTRVTLTPFTPLRGVGAWLVPTLAKLPKLPDLAPCIAQVQTRRDPR